jgi:hypothetical protein
MNLFIKMIQRFLFWLLGKGNFFKKTSGWSWGNSYNDIYILRLLLRSHRERSLNGRLSDFK